MVKEVRIKKTSWVRRVCVISKLHINMCLVNSKRLRTYLETKVRKGWFGCFNRMNGPCQFESDPDY